MRHAIGENTVTTVRSACEPSCGGKFPSFRRRQTTDRAMLTCISGSHQPWSLIATRRDRWLVSLTFGQCLPHLHPLEVNDGWGLFRRRHYWFELTIVACLPFFVQASTELSPNELKTCVHEIFELQWQCKNIAFSVEYIEEHLIHLSSRNVARPENAFGELCPLDKDQGPRRRHASPISTRINHDTCHYYPRLRITPC